VLILAMGGVVVGFALLVVSLITQNPLWAWGCIAACALSAGVLAVDAWRRGRVRAGGAPGVSAATPDSVLTGGAGAGPGAASLAKNSSAGNLPARDSPAQSEGLSAPTMIQRTEPVQPAQPAEPAEAVQRAVLEAEPGEEDVDAADALVIAGVEHPVLVIDEHPRFHLHTCRSLAGKATLSLSAREALELGFTPCALCSPSRTLAALTRTS